MSAAKSTKHLLWARPSGRYCRVLQLRGAFKEIHLCPFVFPEWKEARGGSRLSVRGGGEACQAHLRVQPESGGQVSGEATTPPPLLLAELSQTKPGEDRKGIPSDCKGNRENELGVTS